MRCKKKLKKKHVIRFWLILEKIVASDVLTLKMVKEGNGSNSEQLSISKANAGSN